MTADLPDDLRSFDQKLSEMFANQAPEAGMNDRILAHLRRGDRYRISPVVIKAASAVAAVLVLGAFGYVADRQLNAPQEALAYRAEGRVSSAPNLKQMANQQLDRLGRRVEEKTRESQGQGEGATGAEGNHDIDGQSAVLADGTAKYRNEDVRSGSFPNTRYSGAADAQKELTKGRSAQSARDRDTDAPGMSANTGLGVEGSSRADGKQRGEPGWAETKSENIDGPVVVAGLVNDLEKVADRLKQNETTLRGLKDRENGKPRDGAQQDEAAPGNRSAADASKGSPEVHYFRPLASAPGGGGGGGATEEAAKRKEGAKTADAVADARAGEKKANESVSTSITGPATPKPGDPPTIGAGANNGAGNAPGQQQTQPAAEQPAAPQRKVIRSGNIEFEVDSFDSSLMTVTKLVMEDGGFVASTDSAKLQNGKTRGMITVRIPPDRVDAFVLKLRGLGDLKNQKITSQDVSKSYSDTESSLRAARAMEERLLEMIKEGQGQIKDLLAAEKELGVWREKIEQYEGEKRYYDNLIGLSTLVVTLTERDIKSAAGSVETERIDAGIETDDVEKGRADFLKAVDESKGRIVSSDLKKLDGGQFAARITAEVDADKAGPLIDRLKQLGKVARLDVDRRQTSVDGQSPPVPGAKVEKRPTILSVSLYNLANVAPRLTTTATVATADVDATYRALMLAVEKAGGRAISSQLQRPRPDDPSATLRLEAPSASAADFEAALKAAGEVLNMQLSENADTANVTTAKQGFVVQLVALANVPPRLTNTSTLAAEDVEKAYAAILAAADKSSGRVVASNMQRPSPEQLTAVIQIEVPREQVPAFEATLGSLAELMKSSITETGDRASSTRSKQAYDLRFLPATSVPARQTATLQVAAKDVSAAHKSLATIAEKKGVRVIQSSVTEGDRDRVSAVLQLDLPRSLLADWDKALAGAGDVLTRSVVQSTDTQNTLDSKVRVNLTLFSADHVPPRQSTTASVRVESADSTQATYVAMAQQGGGVVVDQSVSRDPNGRGTVRLVIDVPRNNATQVIAQLRTDGELLAMHTVSDPRAPDGPLARARFDLTFTEAEALVGRDAGFWASIKGGLSTSLRGLAWSLQLIIVGLCLVAPWLLIVWFAVRFIRKQRAKRQVAIVTA